MINKKQTIGDYLIGNANPSIEFISKDVLLSNIDKLHTTEMGVDRIKRNIMIKGDDVVEYCKNKIQSNNCNLYRRGKNWYCEVDGLRITVNSYSYTIITAHLSDVKC